jgi:predicted house-cleaning noncanonical NTP pyrophosphatase (MazG superfamily)
MEKVIIRKLTEEEKQKIIFVINDLLSDDIPEEPTEYDVLMKQKLEEFTAVYLKDNEPSQIEALLEICDNHIKGENFSCFGLIMAYDMWINESAVWPVMHNPKWKEWEKLKKKKVKKIAPDE